MYITKPTRKSQNGKTYQTILLWQSYREGGRVKNRTIANLTHCKPEEIATSRDDKRKSVESFLLKQNNYLAEHPKASVTVALQKVQEKIERLQLTAWLSVEAIKRELVLRIDKSALEHAARLDGCYVIKSDLPKEAADKQMIHDRYKDLAEVKWAFRTCKSAHLEICPLYVRTEESTRAHGLVVMLAYKIVRELRRVWSSLDVTMEEGLRPLETLCSMEIVVKDQASCHQIPEPREESKKLLEAIQVTLPTVLPHGKVKVVTKRKFPSRR